MKMSRSIMGWVAVIAVLLSVTAGIAIAASDSETPAAADTDTTPTLVGATLTGGAGGAGGAAGGAGGGATGGGGADVRVAQY